MNVVEACDGSIAEEGTIECNKEMTEPIEDLVCLLTMNNHSSMGGAFSRELDEQDVLSVLDDNDDDSNDVDEDDNKDGNVNGSCESNSDDEACIDDGSYVEGQHSIPRLPRLRCERQGTSDARTVPADGCRSPIYKYFPYFLSCISAE